MKAMTYHIIRSTLIAGIRRDYNAGTTFGIRGNFAFIIAACDRDGVHAADEWIAGAIVSLTFPVATGKYVYHSEAPATLEQNEYEIRTYFTTYTNTRTCTCTRT